MKMLKVLIVDDEKDIADHIKFLVEDMTPHAEVSVFYSGTRALISLQSVYYDLLITDIVMPVTDGFKLLTYIVENNLDTEVIFLSAHREFDFIYRANQLKKIDYIIKTEQDSLIRETISHVMKMIDTYSENRLLIEEAKKKSQDNLKGTEEKKQSDDDMMVESEIINQIKLYIKNNMNSDLSVSQIADVFHYNPAYLSRIFRFHCKEKISAYILREKMESAKRYLIETKHSVSTISGILGYQSSQSFIRTFRKELNMTPQEYRRNYERREV